MRDAVPDVVIMDSHMPVMDGAEATHAISEEWPGVRVFAFTSTGELGRIAPMLRAGARGCLLKGQSPEELVASVRSSLGSSSFERRAHGQP